MDFGMGPLSPLKLGVEPEYYESILDSYRLSEDSYGAEVTGNLEIGGTSRLVRCFLKDNRVDQIELCEVTPEDTFRGVPLSYRYKKFQKALLKEGYNSRFENEVVDLVDHPVGFFIYGKKPASVCWG